jgi:hypothetical protein
MCFVRETFLEHQNSNIGSYSSTLTTDPESNLLNCIKDHNSSYDSRDHMCVYETPRDPTRFMNN